MYGPHLIETKRDSFFKGAGAGGEPGIFLVFCLFSLSRSALDHSATAPPRIVSKVKMTTLSLFFADTANRAPASWSARPGARAGRHGAAWPSAADRRRTADSRARSRRRAPRRRPRKRRRRRILRRPTSVTSSTVIRCKLKHCHSTEIRYPALLTLLAPHC